MNTDYFFYDGYSPEELAEDAFFQQWVIFAQPEEELFWETYLHLYPEQQDNVRVARELVLGNFNKHEFEPLTAEEKSSLKQEIFDQIMPAVPVAQVWKRNGLRLLKIAAVAAGLVFIAVNYFKVAPQSSYSIVEKTGDDETRTILLGDSSEVILNANSSLTYSSDIAISPVREVQLIGNAFFRIRKKADHRKFAVLSNGLLVSVLGTEFNVNARSVATEVVLTSGKVEVSEINNPQKPVLMLPGEKVQFDPGKKAFTKSTADTRIYQAWSDGRWHFSSTSLAEITTLIYAYYGVESSFSDPKMKNLKINAVIPVTDLKAFINIISRTLDIDIVLRNNQLIIQQ
ncbi:FecR family protein [Flavihumibacter fluvii]|uniref:FecR family protein n=1 Tax=Flavihumibacter fluvii TaxID=2838157 RepID=UPI001BDE1F1C|nr:FecR domain-containing protein [Flavihumibacter fluvii]ULQ54148.1 FecR domain-containing protein [Flavihumibacter fluvii]